MNLFTSSTSRHHATIATLVALWVLVAACSGSSSPDKASPAAAKPRSSVSASAVAQGPEFQPVVAPAEPLVGANRFALGILDGKTQSPLPDATVHFRFFGVQGNQATARFEADAIFRAPAREAGLAPSVPHRHLDGSTHTHSNAEADIGVYTAEATFDKPGAWGVEAQIAAKDGRKGVIRAGFNVVATSAFPAPGQPAPRSRQPTVRDVKDISEIDSAAEPDPTLHDLTMADSIATGKPTVVIFATPGFCSSRLCGPSVEIVKKVRAKYAGKVNFMHIEVYKDFVNLTPSDTFSKEWRLTTEPWVFVIDGSGIISGRLDGPFTSAELDALLAKVAS